MLFRQRVQNVCAEQLVPFVLKPWQRGFHQASRITLPAPCRFDNSLGDDVAHYFWSARVVKCLAGSVKSFDHGRKRLGSKLPGRYQGTD
jgi:hypothetical protein